MPSALLEEVPRVWLLAGFGLSLALNLLLLLLLAGRRRRPAAPAPAGLAEQRLAAEHAVAAALAATSSWEEAAPGVLRALCDNLGWDRAEFWEVGPSGERITLRASWPAPGAAEPRAVPGKGVCAPGEGLPGRVWASGRPLWVEDVRRDSTLPPDATVRAAFGFPVRLDEEILGVVICYDRSIRQSREDLLGMAGAVGSQLGQYIRRTRAEQELRAGERFAAAVIDG
ncbi:MAG TPA: GAF domain-containing protein, partial [Gemmataceae bacterium]